MAYARRDCRICHRSFQPRHRSKPMDQECRSCRDLLEDAGTKVDLPFKPGIVGPPSEGTAAPMRQAVFDIETWGLDRGWGLVLMAHILVHGGSEGPQWFTFDLRQSPGWPDKRSDDSWIARQVIGVLKECHIAYAHNGLWFDIPYLNSVALIYGMERLRMKLVDPYQVAKRKYRLGNSLGALANALNLPQKMPLPPEVWRKALLDNDDASWGLLHDRCHSDVEILNLLAGKMANDVGMIDYGGSNR